MDTHTPTPPTRTFITFAVSPRLGIEGREPLWRQVDWKITSNREAYGRDAAEQFAHSGNAQYGQLYATVLVADTENSDPSSIGSYILYWHMFGRVESMDPSHYLDSPQAEEEGRQA